MRLMVVKECLEGTMTLEMRILKDTKQMASQVMHPQCCGYV